MTETKWTPGPWHRAEEHESMVQIQQVNPPYVIVGRALGSIVLAPESSKRVQFDVMQANAALMAAAPDLYEALERLVHEFAPESMEAWNQARASLARARGETP